ncbi:MAG: nucleotidyltransferase domain-containing protein [Thermomicrobiales bacterium]
MTQPPPIPVLPPAPPGSLPAEVAAHLDAIRALGREYGVRRLELFGSAVTARFDPANSDFDVLVEYPPDHDLGPWMRDHFALRDRLAALLGRPVDLVILEAIRRPRFIEAIRDNRRLLYAA